MGTKICSKCGEEMLLKHFKRWNICEFCVSLAYKKYCQENKKKIKQKRYKKYEKYRLKTRETQQKYYLKNIKELKLWHHVNNIKNSFSRFLEGSSLTSEDVPEEFIEAFKQLYNIRSELLKQSKERKLQQCQK